MCRFVVAIFILISSHVGASADVSSVHVSDSFITTTSQLSEIDTTKVDVVITLGIPFFLSHGVAPDSTTILFTEAANVPTTHTIIRAPPTAQ